MIFFRKDSREFEKKINYAVFPALQGGPHEHQIAGVATQLKEVMTPEFRSYAKAVRANARAVAAALTARGYTMATGGTDNHLVLWDLRPTGITGSKFEKLADACSITVNKNSVFGDRSAVSPGGVRIGAPALTTRGMGEADFQQIATFLHEVVVICKKIQGDVSDMKLVDFVAAIKGREDVAALKAAVETFAKAFPMPGFDVAVFMPIIL